MSDFMAFKLQVVFDCKDPAALAKFYAEALHYKRQDPPAGFPSWEAWLRKRGIPEHEWNSADAIVDPEGKGPRVYFQQMDTLRGSLNVNYPGLRPLPSLSHRASCWPATFCWKVSQLILATLLPEPFRQGFK